MTPKAEETKVKTDKLNYIKIRNFCASKETINSECYKVFIVALFKKYLRGQPVFL